MHCRVRNCESNPLSELDRAVSSDRWPRSSCGASRWRASAAGPTRTRETGDARCPGLDPADARMRRGSHPRPTARTARGRMFTGDRSGDFLYSALHRAGFGGARAASISRDDGMVLDGVRVSAAVRCAPRANKPTPVERDKCRRWSARRVVAAAWRGSHRLPRRLCAGRGDRAGRGRTELPCRARDPGSHTGRSCNSAHSPCSVCSTERAEQRPDGWLTGEMIDAVIARAVALTAPRRSAT